MTTAASPDLAPWSVWCDFYNAKPYQARRFLEKWPSRGAAAMDQLPRNVRRALLALLSMPAETTSIGARMHASDCQGLALWQHLARERQRRQQLAVEVRQKMSLPTAGGTFSSSSTEQDTSSQYGSMTCESLEAAIEALEAGEWTSVEELGGEDGLLAEAADWVRSNLPAWVLEGMAEQQEAAIAQALETMRAEVARRCGSGLAPEIAAHPSPSLESAPTPRSVDPAASSSSSSTDGTSSTSDGDGGSEAADWLFRASMVAGIYGVARKFVPWLP